MLIDNIDFLKKVILFLADQQYKNEVEDTAMEESIVGDGPNCDYKTKEDWMQDTIEQWFEETKEKFKIEIVNSENVLPSNNTILDRFYNLDFGDSFDFDNFSKIIRVPGGWLYKTPSDVTFIPFIVKNESKI